MLSFLTLCSLGIAAYYVLYRNLNFSYKIMWYNFEKTWATEISYPFTSLLNIWYVCFICKVMCMHIVFVFSASIPLLPFSFLVYDLLRFMDYMHKLHVFLFFSLLKLTFVYILYSIPINSEDDFLITQVSRASRGYHLDGTVCSSVVSVYHLRVWHLLIWLFSS